MKRLEAGQPVRIVCFGDSVTGVYYHTGNHRAWCDLVGLGLRRVFPAAQLEMINAGISGHTTADSLARMDRDVISKHPDLVLVMLGLNDVAKAAAETYRANLRTIVERARAAGAEVVLMTPNCVSAGDALRPVVKVADYAAIVREAAQQMNVPLCDTYRAFQAVQSTDSRAWLRIMSDTIHPNFRGHELFAEEVVHTLTGRRVALEDLTPTEAGLSRLAPRLRAGQKVKIVAMKPFDTLITPAIHRAFPQAQVDVVAWDAANQSIVDLEAKAKSFGWSHYYTEAKTETKPDLFIVAVPATALAATEAQFFHSYTWVVNWSQSFDPKAWDCLVVLPSVAHPDLDAGGRTVEAMAREVVTGQDVPWLERKAGDQSDPAELFERWIEQQLRK